ncbi:MAG: hypothetical protein ABIJ56_19540 [Pseudomonadota bacterium]
MRLNQFMDFINALCLTAILVSGIVLAGCYQKSLRTDGDDNGDECDPDVFIEITPNPVIEELEGCPNPVYMNLEYKVTNDSGRQYLIEKVKLEGRTKVGAEEFFEWEYYDDEHNFVDAGRFYIVRLDGILVSAEIDHTDHFEYGEVNNEIKTTLYFHIEDEEAECVQFQASDSADIAAVLKTGECSVDN